MAALSQFAININLDQSRTNPINSLTFQAVAPWGQSSKRATLQECLMDIAFRAGSQQGGMMGAYMNSQTLNGATGSGATAYSSANEVGIP